MSFREIDLSVLAYANNFTLWHYKLQDRETVDILLNTDFFNRARDMLRRGDIIEVTHADAAVSPARLHVKLENADQPTRVEVERIGN